MFRKVKEDVGVVSPELRDAARLANNELDQLGVDRILDETRRERLTKNVFQRHGLLDESGNPTIPGAEEAVLAEIDRRIGVCDQELDREEAELEELRRENTVAYWIARLTYPFRNRG